MFELHRPSSSSDPAVPYVVYPSSLFCLGLGYALWYPEPHESGEPQIGDVGYVSEGAFIRIFNLNASKDAHKVAFWDVPFKNTEPLPESVFRPDKRRRPIDDGRYPSRGVTKRELHASISTAAFADAAAALSAGYTCKEAFGALLVLQSQGYSEAVFAMRKLKKYIIRHHDEWCTYVRDDLGNDVSPKEIIFVSGWVKTSADWAATAFSNIVAKNHASLQGHFGKFVGLELFRSRTRVQSGPPMHRKGEHYPRDTEKGKGKKKRKWKGKGKEKANAEDELLRKDQSIFLKRCKTKKRLGVVKTVVAGAGYHHLPDNSNGGGRRGQIAADESQPQEFDPDDDGLFWRSGSVIDPLDILLDYVLEVSDADVAIARDEDIENMLGTDAWPIDFSTYLRRAQPPVELDEGYGTISIPRLLSREQTKRLERRFITSADLRKWPKISYDGAGTPSMARATFTTDADLLSDLPTKWPYLEFRRPSSSSVSVTSFVASPDGEYLAVTAGTLEIVVWRLSDGLKVQSFEENGHTEPICSLAFSPDSRRLMSGAADKTIIVWSMATGRPVLRLDGYRDVIRHMSYTVDGAFIASTCGDTNINFSDASTGAPRCTFHHESRVEGFLHSPSSTRLAVRMQRGVALYDASARGPVVRLGACYTSPAAKVFALALSHDGMQVFMGDNVRNGCIYDVDSSQERARLARYDEAGPMVAAAFASDGTRLAAVGDYDAVWVWDTATGELLMHLETGMRASTVAFSPNGAFLAAAGGGTEEANVRVWDWKTRELVADFVAPSRRIEDMVFVKDSRRLLTFAKEGPVCAWDVADVLRLR